MLITKKSRVAAGASLAFVAALALSACSTASTGDMDDEMAETPMTEQTTPMDDMEEMDATAYLVGAGCAEYAEAVPSGAGSVDGMAMDPVATAASNNPLLTTLTAAVSGGLNPDVNLVDTLNGGEFTVFAPVADAFAKIDQATRRHHHRANQNCSWPSGSKGHTSRDRLPITTVKVYQSRLANGAQR